MQPLTIFSGLRIFPYLHGTFALVFPDCFILTLPSITIPLKHFHEPSPSFPLLITRELSQTLFRPLQFYPLGLLLWPSFLFRTLAVTSCCVTQCGGRISHKIAWGEKMIAKKAHKTELAREHQYRTP